ncbi:bombyxin B-2-like [Tachypleus tridentatus]|uniref:bombyxin B-2-like n=1 Tax=Tachypleus tridentatus TaxID=6853 RepID=UPI003FD61C2B
MNWQLLLALCTCTAVTYVLGLPNQHKLQTRSQKFCGRHLAEALALVCNNVYYTPSKRTDSDFTSSRVDLEPWWTVFSYIEPKPDDGFLDGRTARAVFGKRDIFFRKMRGVADECCRKGCSISELTSYCGQH